MIDIQHTIYLRQMPTQPLGQLGLPDILITHSLVQDHFDSGKGRQYGMGRAPRRRHRNVLPVMDTCGNGLLQRIDGTPQRLITIFSKCRQFRKIRRRY